MRLAIFLALAGSALAAPIPFDLANHLIVLQARLNGAGPIPVLLDSGAQGMVVDPARAAALGLEAAGEQVSHGAGGAQQGSMVHGVDVELPGLRLRGQALDTLALGALGASAGTRLEGILGHPVFNGRVVEIDYPRRRLTLLPVEGYRYEGPGKAVPIERIDELPYVTASVVLPGGESLRGRFVIDTGASSGLILAPEALTEPQRAAVLAKTRAAEGRGVGGSVELRLARVERLELGGFALGQPIALFQPRGAGRVSAPGTLGNIGGAVLDRFKVIFDDSRSRMILEPGPRLAEPFEADMSGLGLIAPPPEFSAIQVARVQERSPAQELGIRAGDVIESVDDAPVAQLGLAQLRERLRHDAQQVRFVLRRGEERIRVTLRTRRMI
ncbi:MAG TPA: aspartyl protease family protein [Candidatus Polarisedimenticolaceae bacterium]|nr:aspartyl protease family protein [Candidatus Polarisedimenticolaceae bacterium]